MVEILKFVPLEAYEFEKSLLKEGESKTIYESDKFDIDITRLGKKVYTIINTYGNKSLNEVLNNVCKLI